MVNELERKQIRLKMAQLGTVNMGAYLRKMAIDGCVINLDLSDVKELVSLLRRCSNNLNQYTKRAHETSSIYAADIEDLSHMLDGIWTEARKILATLAKL
ncbi:MAG: plasmid mobilization relaxosome protein MobC [Clostridia bacterium]